jgi:hypothetical protein
MKSSTQIATSNQEWPAGEIVIIIIIIIIIFETIIIFLNS